MKKLNALADKWHAESAAALKKSEHPETDRIASLRLFAQGTYLEMCAQELERAIIAQSNADYMEEICPGHAELEDAAESILEQTVGA